VQSSPLPLAGEADALDRARRVGALTTHTGIPVGHPHPDPPPRERERGKKSALARGFCNLEVLGARSALLTPRAAAYRPLSRLRGRAGVGVPPRRQCQ
jgi:hypothetical protein